MQLSPFFLLSKFHNQVLPQKIRNLTSPALRVNRAPMYGGNPPYFRTIL